MGRDPVATLTEGFATGLGRTMRRAASLAGRAALDFLLPPACASCERAMDEGEPGVVCGRCWARLAPLPVPQCRRCGHPLRGAACRWCALLPAHVAHARSTCWMHRGTGPEIVHALKYRGWHAVAADMASRMARVGWPSDAPSIGALLPVPLAAARLRERGFNQSELLARTLAERWRVRLACDVLGRARATETQTRLTPEQRLANVSGAFRVRESRRRLIQDAHVVLVDDVVTTAATLNACAAALIAAGARAVSYVTFGRAPASGDR